MIPAIRTAAQLEEFFRDFGVAVAQPGETLPELVERVMSYTRCPSCGEVVPDAEILRCHDCGDFACVSCRRDGIPCRTDRTGENIYTYCDFRADVPDRTEPE